MIKFLQGIAVTISVLLQILFYVLCILSDDIFIRMLSFIPCMILCIIICILVLSISVEYDLDNNFEEDFFDEEN
jgi:hypothetical protein